MTKRLKTKGFVHEEVAFLWARQEQERAEGSNMFFEGDTIYSYGRHFPIARIVDGLNCVLFTTHDYSVSTSTHKRVVQCNLVGSRLFHVPDVLACGPRGHEANYTDFLDRAMTNLKSSERRRKPETRRIDLTNARWELGNALAYARKFNVPEHNTDQLRADVRIRLSAAS